MAAKSQPVLLSMATREVDGVRCGVFGTGDPEHPLLIAVETEPGSFDVEAARPIPAAEAFDMLRQINAATNTLN